MAVYGGQDLPRRPNGSLRARSHRRAGIAVLWGPDHVYADGICLSVEVVSPSSLHDDHVIKPRELRDSRASRSILVVDSFQSTFKLLSQPGEGYADEVTHRRSRLSFPSRGTSRSTPAS